MKASVVKAEILKNLEFEPTAQQFEAIGLLSDFMARPGRRQLFILKGFAGTGKTTLVGALVRALRHLRIGVKLAAPTGRAAKVLQGMAGFEAQTIHKLIYRRKSSDPGSGFVLDYNKFSNSLFIIDESSMLASGSGDGTFGSGDLLSDLLDYVYAAPGCRLLLLGDTAQLPPVKFDDSPALNAEFMAGYDCEVDEYCLSEVVRQQGGSGILRNATMLRRCIESGEKPRFELSDDVRAVSGADLIEEIDSSYGRAGEEETIVITRSNKRAGRFASGIRGSVLQRESLIERNDLLMVVRNNYSAGEAEGIEFIANGDIARVVKTGGEVERFGFVFRNATLYFPDMDKEVYALLLQDSLSAENPAALQELGRRLFASVEQEKYADIKSRSKRYRKLLEDPFVNALQVKSAYAVTCHKAQGGQWKHVYIDMALYSEIDEDALRYLYTALTRATERVYLINPPRDMLAGSENED